MRRALTQTAARAAVAALLLGAAGPSYSAEWQTGLSLSLSTGDYGEEGTTEMLYVPATVKRYLPRGDLSLTVPYVDISSDGGVIIVDGDVVRIDRDLQQDASGLGDILFKARYYAVEQDDRWPFVDLVAGLKLPTADEDEGLGTGEVDVSVGVELSRWFEGKYLGLLELGYVLTGDPPGVDLNNRLVYSVGGGYQYNADVLLTAYLDGRTALTDDSEGPLSLLLIGEYKRHEQLRFDLMLEFGLSDGAADAGVMVGARYRI